MMFKRIMSVISAAIIISTMSVSIIADADVGELSFGKITVNSDSTGAEKIFTATVDAVNNTASEAEVEMIVAHYSEDGRLKAVNKEACLINPGTNTCEISYAPVTSNDGDYLKVFLWDSITGIEPYTVATIKDLNEQEPSETPIGTNEPSITEEPIVTEEPEETSIPTNEPMDYSEPELSTLSMWYDEPAAEDDSVCWTTYDAVKVTDRYKESHLVWKQKALPIGNGYQGAMIFGGVAQERIQLNEKTLWEGKPEHVTTDKTEAFHNAREAMLAGDAEAAYSYAEGMAGSTKNYGTYTTFGNLAIDFTNIPAGAEYTDFVRGLDLENSKQIVAYTVDGIRYSREYFASYPDRAMAMRFNSDHKGSISFKLSFTNQPNSSKDVTTVFENGILKVTGALNNNGMRWAGEFKIENIGGTVSFDEETKSVVIDSADSVVIKTALATDYKADEASGYRTGIAPVEVTDEIISAVADKSFDEMYENHLNDYKSIFDNVFLNIAESNETPTDEMMENNRRGESNIMLDQLFYQYGRYMLISSSRDGSLPANLQGVWNDMKEPAWYSDYHININLQMNYYPAANGNMLECMGPLIDWVERTMETGKITAKNIYGCNGWVSHHMNNPFGFTDLDPTALSAALSPESSAWISLSCWDLYDYSQNEEYLPRIYNIIQEAVRFYSEYLYYDTETGEYMAGPSYSPEQTDILTMGAKIDQQLIKKLYDVYIEASDFDAVSDLTDTVLLETVKDQVDKLQTPVAIGPWGNIMEWNTYQGAKYEEESGHRHISHLLSLYPLDQITRRNPELLTAARTTLNARGDDATGWSRANKVQLWARAIGQDSDSASTTRGDSYIQNVSNADRAYSIYQGLIQDMVYDNFFDWHPLGSNQTGKNGVFQIDGNFGITAAMGEFLLQSHDGYLDILPSLPTAWEESGSVRGLLGRGGYEVDVAWSYGRPTEAVIKNVKDSECRVYKNDEFGNVTITCDGNNIDYSIVDEDGLQLIVFDAEADKAYTLSYSIEGHGDDVVIEKKTNATCVYSIDADNITIHAGTTVAELFAGIRSSLGGAQTYVVTDSENNTVDEASVIEKSGCILTVTSPNGLSSAEYAINIIDIRTWNLTKIVSEKTTLGEYDNLTVEFDGLTIKGGSAEGDYIDPYEGVYFRGASGTGANPHRYIAYTPDKDGTMTITAMRAYSGAGLRYSTAANLSGGTVIDELNNAADWAEGVVEMSAGNTYYFYCNKSGMKIKNMTFVAFE